MDDAKALLDSLMGPSRNSGKSSGDEFKAKNVCKNYLVGFCPNEWFINTKRQMKLCEKVHSDAMKEQLEAHPNVDKLRKEYENEFLRFLERLTNEADESAKREQRTLRPPSKQVVIPDHLKGEYRRLETEYEEAVTESKDCEQSGDLGGSEKAMQKADGLEAEIMKMNEENTCVFEGEELCEICGVRIAKADDSWNPHYPGKLHEAYVKIRQKVAELTEKKHKAKIVPEETQDSKNGAEDNKKEGDRRRSRSQGRNKGKSRRSRSREARRSRSREARRSRSRKARKSRSRDKGSDRNRRDQRRSRSRERRGDRGDRGDRGRRSRSRSRRR